MEQCTFGDAILFSDQKPADGPYRWVRIPPLVSIDVYSRFCLYHLADFIKTPYALIVQWDGYVVNAAAWANAFRKYDYIGAAWHGLFPPGVPLVGNGGFSLRSRKLLQASKKLPPVGNYHEDRVICHVFGKQLEQREGIRFAPVKVADRFSYEHKIPETTPFGFHGIQHMWRHISKKDFAAVVAQMDIRKIQPDRMSKLIRNCAENGMPEAAAGLLAKARAVYSTWGVAGALKSESTSQTFAAELVELDQLVKGSAET